MSVGDEADRMPDISVSEDQRERLRWVQKRLAEEVEYGHVRPCDAVEYLLDRFDEEATGDGAAGAGETGAAQSDADATTPSDAGPGDAGDADGEPPTFEVRNGAATAAARSTAPGGAPADGDAASDGSDGDPGDEAGDADPSGDGGGGAADEESDETRLNAVMSLLEDNADVWREADGGEEKYVVDLPDGTTERARTKDDVRAVLFRHYR
jgi:hypothetical protein